MLVGTGAVGTVGPGSVVPASVVPGTVVPDPVVGDVEPGPEADDPVPVVGLAVGEGVGDVPGSEGVTLGGSSVVVGSGGSGAEVGDAGGADVGEGDGASVEVGGSAGPAVLVPVLAVLGAGWSVVVVGSVVVGSVVGSVVVGGAVATADVDASTRACGGVGGGPTRGTGIRTPFPTSGSGVALRSSSGDG